MSRVQVNHRRAGRCRASACGADCCGGAASRSACARARTRGRVAARFSSVPVPLRYDIDGQCAGGHPGAVPAMRSGSDRARASGRGCTGAVGLQRLVQAAAALRGGGSPGGASASCGSGTNPCAPGTEAGGFHPGSGWFRRLAVSRFTGRGTSSGGCAGSAIRRFDTRASWSGQGRPSAGAQGGRGGVGDPAPGSRALRKAGQR
jgi:hypothetical protein